MFVLIEWEDPVDPKNNPPKYGRAEIILEELATFDRARKHVHTLKAARRFPGRFRIRALDILTETIDVRVVPLPALNALIEAARKAAADLRDGMGYDDYPADVDAIVSKLQPFIDLEWLQKQRVREAEEEKVASAAANIKLAGDSG